MFNGTITAIITPFKGDSGIKPEVDYDALEALVEWQLESGVNGLCILGTTAECATLDACLLYTSDAADDP